MLKKTVTYEDFNEKEVTEDLYFHLTKAELIKINAQKPGGYGAWLEGVNEDPKSIMEFVDMVLLAAYGKRSSDGANFIKNDLIREEFASSKAYDELFTELVTDAAKAAEFSNGVVPPNLAEEVAKIQAKAEAQQPVPEEPPKPRALTRVEALEMSDEELSSGLATGRYILSNQPE